MKAEIVLAGDRGPSGHPGLRLGKTRLNSIQVRLKYLKNGSSFGISIGKQFGCRSMNDLPQHSSSPPKALLVPWANVMSWSTIWPMVTISIVTCGSRCEISWWGRNDTRRADGNFCPSATDRVGAEIPENLQIKGSKRGWERGNEKKEEETINN